MGKLNGELEGIYFYFYLNAASHYLIDVLSFSIFFLSLLLPYPFTDGYFSFLSN